MGGDDDEVPPPSLGGDDDEVPPPSLGGDDDQVPPPSLGGDDDQVPPPSLGGDDDQVPPPSLGGDDDQVPPPSLGGDDDQVPPPSLGGDDDQVPPCVDTLSLLDVVAWLSTVIAKLSLLRVPVSSLVSSLLCIVLLLSTLFLVATVPAVRQADCRLLQRRLLVPRTERRQRLPRLLCH